MRRRLLWCSWLAFSALGSPTVFLSEAYGQILANGGPERAGVASDPLWSWSTQGLVGEIPEGVAGVETGLFGLLVKPAPRSGLFWTAGNPGAIPWEVAEQWSSLAVERWAEEGSYRRPLEARRLRRNVVGGVGWRPLGEGGVAGRLSAARDALGRPAVSNVSLPYRSNPHVVLDTTGAPLARTAVGLEGAAGWRRGRAGFGLALGYETQHTRTEQAPVPRSIRGVSPSLALGTSVEVRPGLRAGLHGRWQAATQEVTIYSVSAVNRVYQLEGYGEPRPRDVQSVYRRRMEREGSEIVLSFGGALGGVPWVAFGGFSNAREDQWNQLRTQDPPKDVWTISGRRLGLAAEPSLWDGAEAVASVAHLSLEGESTRIDPSDITAFRAEHSRLIVETTFRYDIGGTWQGALQASVSRDARRREDLLERATTDLTVWSGLGGVEVGRELSGQVGASLGVSFGWRSPSGSVPYPFELGPVYRSWLAPAVALEASEAHTYGGAFTLRWRRGSRTAFWVKVEGRSLSPTEGEQAPSLVPTGSRTWWRISLGALRGGAEVY